MGVESLTRVSRALQHTLSRYPKSRSTAPSREAIVVSSALLSLPITVKDGFRRPRSSIDT